MCHNHKLYDHIKLFTNKQRKIMYAFKNQADY